MSLKFWLGGARSDKSHKLYKYILEEADKHQDRNYLVVVPEQFTLSTQRELVNLSDKHGILNVDVLSFMRLAHRLEDEVGSANPNITILDDMGKNLILSLLSQKHRNELSVFGDNIDKLGYITKVKSLLSELMQYGVDIETVSRMADEAKKDGRVLLSEKLNDANILYGAFKEYIKNEYTTTEETLAATASIVHMSDTIKNSVIIFDGFTGFTPVQNELIVTLMDYAKEVHVSLIIEQGDYADSSIFTLSKRTMDKLGKKADEHRIVIAEDYISDVSSYRSMPKLHLFSAIDREEEIKIVILNIKKLIKEKNLSYRDFAIITGDLEGYRRVIERCFDKEDIPYFIDKTQPMLLNPFVEYIRALLETVANNYSYDSMFRFLKSGLSNFEKKDIDILDNYCLATGIKGYTKWHERFVRTTNEVDEEKILELEELRKCVISRIDDFTNEVLTLSGEENKTLNAATKASVRSFAIALYGAITRQQIEDKLKNMAKAFEEELDRDKKEEYSQIYRRIMDVLDELVKLIPEEKVDVKTFLELINAGLDEIRIGVAPLGNDYVQIGDLTRSRIGDVKCLFLVGVNDGIIPSASVKTGIINETDREFLTGDKVSVTLAPTSKEEAYTQRLYIYMALNKPSEHMYVSYAKVDQAGKSLMPSYLIRKLKKDNPGIKINTLGDIDLSIDENKFNEENIIRLGQILNKSTKTTLDNDEEIEAKSLLQRGLNNTEYAERVEQIVGFVLAKNAYMRSGSVGKAVARALYGQTIKGTVTRLETYANCAYQYFLRYGIRLNDRELFSFESRDLGTIFHDSLSEFAGIISRRNYNWFTLPIEESAKIMDEAVEITVAKRKMASLYSTARTTYMVNRIKRIMRRTAEVVTTQVKKGEFIPKYFEIDFDKMDDLKSLSFKLSEDEMMKLSGRVDRIDTCEKDGNIFVKIIDYKSSGKSMDLAAVYEGKQLQLLVYLNAAIEYEEKKQKGSLKPLNVIPAGVLYYHIDDPLIDGANKSDDEIRDEIESKLRLTGLVNSDENGRAIDLMDMHLEAGSKSSVLNVSRTTKGELSKSKEIISGEELDELRQFVNEKIVELGKEIMSGNIDIKKPDEEKNISAPNCDYCDYKAVCKDK